jgi:FKBP-type peptidyl-prolyl cis-trans isomerase 2
MVDAPVCAFIRRGSHVTLHYRIAVSVDGEGGTLSTRSVHSRPLTIGGAEIAEALENRLLGLAEEHTPSSRFRRAKPLARAS